MPEDKAVKDEGRKPAEGVEDADLSEGQGQGGAPNPPKPSEPPEKDGPDEKPAEAAEKPEDGDKSAEGDKPAEDAKGDPDASEGDEWIEVGDEAADNAISVLREGGMKAAEARELFAEAMETGDPTKVDREALEKKLGKARANLVMLGVTDYMNRENARVQATVQTVHEVMEGQDNWNSVREWAKGKASKDGEFSKTVTELREALDKGGVVAKLAAQEFRRMYEADPKNSSLNEAMVRPDGTGKDTDTGITKVEYVERLKAAHRKGDAAEIQKIERLRAIGRRQGI